MTISGKSASPRLRKVFYLAVLSFLVCEAALRAGGVCPDLGPQGLEQPSPWPDLPFVLAPGASTTYKGFCILKTPESRITISSQGLRDRVYSPMKEDGWTRRAAIGDSVTFGLGVDQEFIFTELWESGLESLGRKVEILNFAAPGYGLREYAAVAEHRATQFKPDEVWVFLIANDLRESSPGSGGLSRKVLLFPIAASRVIRIGFLAVMFGAEYVIEQALPSRFHSFGPMRQAFDRLKALADREGWRVAVVWTDLPDLYEASIRSEAEARGFEFYDAYRNIRMAPRSNHHLPDGHLNRRGHRAVADFLISMEARPTSAP